MIYISWLLKELQKKITGQNPPTHSCEDESLVVLKEFSKQRLRLNHLNIIFSWAINSTADSTDSRGANPITPTFFKMYAKAWRSPWSKMQISCLWKLSWFDSLPHWQTYCFVQVFKSMTVTSYQQIAASSVLKQSSCQFLSQLSGVQNWLPWVLRNPASDTLYKCNFSTCMSILHK